MIGEKETFQHNWYNEWGTVFNRKIQQCALFPSSGKLFCVGGESTKVHLLKNMVTCYPTW